jgi:hypothetical protein
VATVPSLCTADRQESFGGHSLNALPHRERDAMKQYETPALVAAGSFKKDTGLLQSSGNDRLILSKN